MPLTTILVVTGIVCMFVLFAVVLAWGEYQTRHLDRDRHKPETPEHHDDLKRAA